MAQLFPGRYTAKIDDDFVVFLIGMRLNRRWQVWKWLWVFTAMGRMLRTLYQHSEKGFLGSEFFFNLNGPIVIQYWRSFDQLDHFARSKDDPHLEAWRRFNRTVGRDASVGIYHETYLVEAGRYECIYGNMPRFGLGAAAQHARAEGTLATARRRLGGHDEPAVEATY